MDGTFLNSKGIVTNKTYSIIQPLIDRGLNLVIATGRTRDNALAAISPLKLRLPIICDNGAFIYDPVNKKFLLKKNISQEKIQDVLRILLESEIFPFVNSLNGNDILVFYSKLINDAQKSYIKTRSDYGLSKYIFDEHYSTCQKYIVFNISVMESYEKLIDIYTKLKENTDLHILMFPAQYYDGYYWLEILPKDSGKGQAIDFLKTLYTPKKVVCFGDNLNDLCMFERADIKIAPENSVNEVKNIADIIIGDCDYDSVAKYLNENFNI